MYSSQWQSITNSFITTFYVSRFWESEQTRSCNQEEEEANDAGRGYVWTHKRSNKASVGG